MILAAILGLLAAGAVAAYLFSRRGETLPSRNLTPPVTVLNPGSNPAVPESPPPVVPSHRRLTNAELNEVSRRWAKIQGNLRPEEIKAIIMVESAGDPQAVNPADPSWGLMQVTALIGRAFAGDGTQAGLLQPEINLKAGTGFLSDLKRKYETRFPLSDPNNGWVQMYNIGEPKFLSRGIRNPPYQAKFQKFVDRFRSEFL